MFSRYQKKRHGPEKRQTHSGKHEGARTDQARAKSTLSWEGVSDDSQDYKEATKRITAQVGALATIGGYAVQERNHRGDLLQGLCRDSHISALALLKVAGEDIDQDAATRLGPPSMDRTEPNGMDDAAEYIRKALIDSRRLLAVLYNENMELARALIQLQKVVRDSGSHLRDESQKGFATEMDLAAIEEEVAKLGISQVEELE